MPEAPRTASQQADHPAEADGAEPAIHFTLDGRPATASAGEMLISAAERAGTFIPRFCYHPRMKPVGMCRMCLVEVSGPRGATLQPSCFIPVTEGMAVDTTSAKVIKAQEGVLEFLLVNHPLDCPVCDKGGECPLQDQTLAYGPGESRFIEEKRHFEKPVAISELVLLDRERCIQCARCTRFADEVAGEAQIDFAGRGERVEVAAFPTRPFSSYFSGNTVQICPVGALTATPYRFTARPWDLEQVESTCTSCAFGCRAAVQSSANRLTRLLGIDSDPVNHGWLCDKGRFAFESVNGDELAAGSDDEGPAAAIGQFSGEVHESGDFAASRLTEPMVRKGGRLVPASWGEALSVAAGGLNEAIAAGGPGAVAVIGGARLANEDAYAWAKLAKAVIGTDSVDAQLGDGLPAQVVLGLPRATIDQACSAKVVMLLGGDLREELPVLFLRLRAAVIDGGTALIEIAQRPTSTASLAAAVLPARPGDAPALARVLTGDDRGLADLRSHPEGTACPPEVIETARRVLAEAAADGSPAGTGVVVVLGRPSMAEAAAVTVEAAQHLAATWPGARFLPALRRGNVFGALDMGLAPGVLPGRISLADGAAGFRAWWGSVPEQPGRDTAAILGSVGRGGDADDPVRALVLLGADPISDFPDQALARRALGSADLVVAVCGHRSASLAHADVVLPAAVAHERGGTTTNLEGRVTRLAQKLVPLGQAWPDWMIASELATELGGDLGVRGVADLEDEIERLAPAYAGVHRAIDAGPGAADGVLAPLASRGRGPRDPGRATQEQAAGRSAQPIDPIAVPGVESADQQGAPTRVGLAVPAGGGDREHGANRHDSAPATAPGDGSVTDISARVPLLTEVPLAPAAPVHLSPPDSYSLRLVASRRLYDAGAMVAASPSLAALVAPARACANPYDLDRLGVGSGGRVRVRSARGALEFEAVADGGIPRGVVSIDFNVGADGGASNAVSQLIDADEVVTEVRMESL